LGNVFHFIVGWLVHRGAMAFVFLHCIFWLGTDSVETMMKLMLYDWSRIYTLFWSDFSTLISSTVVEKVEPLTQRRRKLKSSTRWPLLRAINEISGRMHGTRWDRPDTWDPHNTSRTSDI
jgi:hypothetical protein